ncbi:MAG: hypothetical protein WCF84_02220 [Anaerolineae bacterium]
MNLNLTSDQISGVAAVIAALAFAYIPGLREWFDGRTGTQKAGIMGLTLVLVAVGALGATCAQLLDVGITCTKTGITTLITNLVTALMANQGAYMLLIRPIKSAAWVAPIPPPLPPLAPVQPTKPGG